MSKKKEPRLTITIEVYEASTVLNVSSTDGVINYYEVMGILDSKKLDLINGMKRKNKTKPQP